MASQGWNSPISSSNDAAVGVGGWAQSDTGPQTASDIYQSTFSTTSSSYQQTNYVKAYNYGFSIPNGSTIDGIIVEISKDKTGGVSTSGLDVLVNIVKSNGTIGSTNKALTASEWPTSLTYVSYGANNDLWGETWTASDINNSNFGVAISGKIKRTSGKLVRYLRIDHMRITVYYTESIIASTMTGIQSMTGIGTITF